MNAYLNSSALAIAALLALGVSIDNPAHAELLVHEPFAYPNGPLAGKSGAKGTTGTWTTYDNNKGWGVHQEGNLSGVNLNNTFGPNLFDGTVANLATSGGYAGIANPVLVGLDASFTGNVADHMHAHIALDPSVTAKFTSGSTTWFSFVSVTGYNANPCSPQIMIATDTHNYGSRGGSMSNSGSGIGGGGAFPRWNNFDVLPHYFNGGIDHTTPGGYLGGVLGGHSGIQRSGSTSATADGVLDNDTQTMPWTGGTIGVDYGAPNIVVGKIEWDAEVDGKDIISVVRFLESDIISEASFDELITAKPALSSANWVAPTTNPSATSNKPDLNQSQFDTLSVAGGKFFIDEIRIATTFWEATGQEPPPAVAPFRLTIARNAPNLDFTWNSQPGKLYRLWSSPNLSSPAPTGWTMVQQDLPANPATLQIAQPANLKLFYVLEEYPAPPMVVFSENFDANVIGWTTGVDGGFATDWEVGTPSLVGPPAAYSGTHCYATNIDSDYGFNADIWLRTPAIDLTAYTTGTLEFFEFKDIENVLGDSDFGRIRILAADDNAPLAIIESGVEGASPTWESYSKVLPVAAFNEPIKIEFQFKSDDYDDTATGPFAGWYIDNVVIRAGGS